MNKIKIKHQLINKSLYNTDIFYFISCKTFWDGGFETTASLEEKCSFYKLANKFSNIIKEILIELNDDVIIGKTISEKSYIFEKWSNINRYDAFMNLTENNGLKRMLNKWDRNELPFTPNCPRSTYNMQIKAMVDYIAVLEARAVMEEINLQEE